MESKSPGQIAQEKKRLKQWLGTLLKDNVDKFDLNAHYDSAVSFSENKEELFDKVRFLVDPDVKMQMEAKESKAMEELETEIENRKIEAEAEKIQREEREKILTSTVNLDEYYYPIETAVRKMSLGYSNGLIVKGIAATGKSFSVTKYLEKYKVKYVVINGDATEAYLYRLFYENKDNVIVLRDTSKVLTNISAINKLKAALETENKRIMTKSSYSKQQSDLPDSFVFNGKIIIELNSTFGLPNGLRDDFDALLSRCEVVDVTFSFEDICKLLLKVCQEDWQTEVTKYIIDNYEFNGENSLNLRSQYHAFKTYKYSQEAGLDWRDELNKSFINKESHIRQMIYRFIGNKTVTCSELAKMLLRAKVYNSYTTANRRIIDWIAMGELIKQGSQKRNYYVTLNGFNKGDQSGKENEQRIQIQNEQI